MDIVKRLREGIDPLDIPEGEMVMDKAADEIGRLQADFDDVNMVRAALKADNERLRERIVMLRETNAVLQSQLAEFHGMTPDHEQQPQPPTHVGRYGESHDGPRDVCIICWNDGRR